FLVEVSLFHVFLNLSSGKTRAERRGKIGESEAHVGSFGDMLLELREIDLIEGIGAGVIRSEVVGFFLVGNEGWDTFKHEVEMIRAGLHGGVQLRDAELCEGSDEGLGCSHEIFSSAHGKPGGLARAGIVDDHANDAIEFIAMHGGVGARTHQAFFFAGKQDEADGAMRLQSRGFYSAEGVDYQRGVASVVERAGAEVPGVEMRTEND